MSAILFTLARMSARSTPDRVAVRLAAHVGITIGEARRRRRWTLRELAARAGASASNLHAIEHGRAASLETYAALALALDLEPRLELVDPRMRAPAIRAEDHVHAAMGEAIARQLARHSFPVAIDEPYQHFQFAGRADVLAWNLDHRALIHVENRTRFPNLQEAIGSYNAKRRYLEPILAERLGLRGGFTSVTHVVAALWSSEVLHTVRLRAETFRAVCPDDPSGLEAWWSGSPQGRGRTSTFVLFDPLTDAYRQRPFTSLEAALSPSTRPRYRGYADAAEAVTRAGRAARRRADDIPATVNKRGPSDGLSGPTGRR